MARLSGSSGDFSKLLLDNFNKKFIETYNGLSGKSKTKVLAYSAVIFKRWFYSSLIAETTLSPSFILNSTLSDKSSLTSPTVIPIVSGGRLKSFRIVENVYSLDNHPVVNDFKTLIDFCSPDIEVDPFNYLNEKDTQEVSAQLSLSDPFYVEYLMAIGFQMGALKNVPAIYSSRACVTNHYISFCQLNQEEALKKIVEYTVRQCSVALNEAIPTSINLFSEKGLINLIKKPLSVDEIFKRVFTSIGVDVEKVWSDYEDNKNVDEEMQEAILSSTFYLGVLLDKWFITPFSEYLKIIEPLYSFSYNFKDELTYLHEVIASHGNIYSAMFSPCALYSFTPFGRLYFQMESGNLSKKKANVISLDELREIISYNNDFWEYRNSMREEQQLLYTIRAKLEENKKIWRDIDVTGENTLHELAMEIAMNFDYELHKYSFFTDANKSPFCEFVSPKAKNKKKKADTVKIEELGLELNKKMYFFDESGETLEVSLVKERFSDRTGHYPQTVKMSKAAREGNQLRF